MPHPPRSNFKITIAGGGIGGLALAIMLERAQIDYIILERSKTLKTLGSTIGLNGCCLRLLEQLGLWTDIEKIQKPIGGFHFYDQDLNTIGNVDFTFGLERYGYYGSVMSRPKLFEILKNHVPKEKILTNKQVLRAEEDLNGVTVFCKDGTEYKSDLVVGADGAYSSIRESIQKKLKIENLLPKKDQEPMALDFYCVLGVTGVLDPKMFPTLRSDFSKFEIMLFKKDPYCQVWFSPIPGNRMSWCYGKRRTVDTKKKEDEEKDTENWNWGLEGRDELYEVIKNTQTSFGCTIDDLVKTTPKELVSSVLLEEKFFEAWHTDRMVLLGDSCHKVMPFAGQGSVQAMLDGVALVNLLHDRLYVQNRRAQRSLSIASPPRPSSTLSAATLSNVLETYRHKRGERSRWAIRGSRLLGQFITSIGFVPDLVRSVGLNWIPQFLFKRIVDLAMMDRPQLVFLPVVEDEGKWSAYGDWEKI